MDFSRTPPPRRGKNDATFSAGHESLAEASKAEDMDGVDGESGSCGVDGESGSSHKRHLQFSSQHNWRHQPKRTPLVSREHSETRALKGTRADEDDDERGRSRGFRGYGDDDSAFAAIRDERRALAREMGRAMREERRKEESDEPHSPVREREYGREQKQVCYILSRFCLLFPVLSLPSTRLSPFDDLKYPLFRFSLFSLFS